MAVNDITIVFSANLAINNAVDRQPASGVEEMLTDAGTEAHEGTAPNQISALDIARIDGTNNDAWLLIGNDGDEATTWFNMRMMFNNTYYMRVMSRGTQGDLTFSVIQVG